VVRWLAPLCKWTFEIAYGVDAEEVALNNFKKVYQSKPVLMIDSTTAYSDPSDPRLVAQVCSFLSSTLPTSDEVAGAQ
jgi:hypothetical protein